MRKVGLIGAVLALGFASPARAQMSRTVELRLQRARVDTIAAHWRLAKARLDAFDVSVAKTRARLDTILIGHLRVLVAPAVRTRIEPAVAATAAHLDSLLGSASTRLEKHWLVVRLYRGTADTISVAAVMTPGRSFPKGREIEMVWGPVNDTLVHNGLRRGAIRLVASELDSTFSRWLGRDFALDTVSTFMWTQARLDLVSSPTTVGRRCYEGDIQSCRLTLQLARVSDPATEWFDAVDRRRFFQHTSRSNYYSPAQDACREGSDAACITAIRQLRFRENSFFAATGVLVGSLTQTALRLGGREGLERLLRSSGPPAQALADAAGVPLDSVLRVWHRNTRDARMPSQDVSLGIAATSLLWIALCGALSLRSSRWR